MRICVFCLNYINKYQCQVLYPEHVPKGLHRRNPCKKRETISRPRASPPHTEQGRIQLLFKGGGPCPSTWKIARKIAINLQNPPKKGGSGPLGPPPLDPSMILLHTDFPIVFLTLDLTQTVGTK